MSSSPDIEGSLYVEISKTWEEMYCCITGRKFQAYRKIRQNVEASRTNRAALVVEFDILINECECKIIKYGLAELSKLMKHSKLIEVPHFFSVNISDTIYKLAASTEAERARWLIYIKNLAKAKERKSDAWVNTGFIEGNYPQDNSNRFSTRNQMQQDRSGKEKKVESSPLSGRPNQIQRRKSMNGPNSPMESKSEKKERDEPRSPPPASPTSQDSAEFVGGSVVVPDSGRDSKEEIDGGNGNGEGGNEKSPTDGQNALSKFAFDEPEEESRKFLSRDSICGIKVDTIVRMVQVLTAFPFVIVVSALNLSNRYQFLRSTNMIRMMNILIYVAPVIYVKFLLADYESKTYQRLAIGFYILLYLWPVGYVVMSKVQVSTSTSKIEEGTFCFKPARTVRLTSANFFALWGFFMEWIQHVLYVLPTGIVTSDQQAKLSDFPPYLSFEVYFWVCIFCVFTCGLIIVLNAVLKGKLHYQFQSSSVVWLFLYNIGSPMYVTIVTILFMSLWCDYSVDPPTLIQQPSIHCYTGEHTTMARAALIALAIYIIQHTLLPSGTFKETMRDNDLEIMFVPVYLQAHYLIKTVFCWFYVYFYNDNLTRVIVLTFINILLLSLNTFMKPCSVSWVNILRDTFFIHATLSGVQALNYLSWPINLSTKNMTISTLASNMLFSSIGMAIYSYYAVKSTEYTIATAFLDLEWQVSRGGSVHPRVLEPLISLTLSTEAVDWEIAKKYIGQLVWLISYPNMRVQFQSAWGLANLALIDDDCRVKIHDAGGTKTLFEWYMDMEFVVQLEALAAMANLTLSLEVAEDMVVRYKCIPFFIDLVTSNKLKHAQFSAIALSNLARKEAFRHLIRKSGGITALVGCIMSHDYQKRRHGCRALANMALSPSHEIEQVFESKGLINKIIKMALRKEIETQREVVALIRNLACHARLRPLLLDRGVMKAVVASKDVVHWCEEITQLLEKEISGGTIDLKALMRREGAKGSAIGETDVELLRKMEPLRGQVEWSTWGSKLESIFSPVFSSVPNLVSSQWVTTIDAPLQVYLPGGLSKTTLAKCRDSLSYIVVERPIHGKLNEYSTTQDYLTYTPNLGYSGTDFFTYKMVMGAISTTPATIAIVVEDGEDEDEDDRKSTATDDDIEKGRKSKSGRGGGGGGGGGGKAKKGRMEPMEVEDGDEGSSKRGRPKGRSGSQKLPTAEEDASVASKNSSGYLAGMVNKVRGRGGDDN